jgi:hypothetical protein
MKLRLLSTIVAVSGLLAFTACKDDPGVGGDGGTGGTGSTTTTPGGGGTGGTGVVTGPTCMDCACVYQSGDTPAGCADTCDNTISGATNPNFCNGVNALSQCAQCIMDRCGETAANCL